MKKIIRFLIIVLLAVGCKQTEPANRKEIIYVGTFTERNSQGLYVFEFHKDSMKFDLLQTIPSLESPSFLEIHPSGRYLYAVSRSSDSDGNGWGKVSAFRIDSLTGKLTFINEHSSYGKGPCHVSFDKTGNFAFVANYNDGNLVVYRVNEEGSVSDSLQLLQDTGKGVNPQRQEGPHVHSSKISPDNKFLYVADLGIDKVVIYNLNPVSGRLTPAATPFTEVEPGSGPRHMEIHPNRKYLFLAEELSSTTSAFRMDTLTGALTEIQRISSIPEDCDTVNTNADIHTDADGKHLYVSNRGDNSLVIYRINSETGNLSLIGFQSTLGDHPRNFLIDDADTLLFVADRYSDVIYAFKINPDLGTLDFTGLSLNVPGAVCIKRLRLHN